MPNYQRSGRHFLQIPGPTNVPDRVLREISRPTMDHRSEEFATLVKEVIAKLKLLLNTSAPIAIFPSTGTGGWEAALVNTLSAGDRVLMFETGHFATLWKSMAEKHGLAVDFVPGDWRHSLNISVLAEHLEKFPDIKAVAVVHNETSTGVVSPVDKVRAVMNEVGHKALLLVDTISSLGSMDYQHDAWGVDVTVAASQKGLMLPPGLSFNVLSERAIVANRTAALPRSFWDWSPIIESVHSGFFPYTPSTNLLYGLNEALELLIGEGLDRVYARHAKLAQATREAIHAWGLEIQCAEPENYSNSLTAVRMPEGHDARALRDQILEKYDMSLGAGLGKLAGSVFRIGHLGSLNELMLAGALSGIEMGLISAKVPHVGGGVSAALQYMSR